MAQNASSDMKNLYCVEYPGKVQNIDRAIATLGGIHTISNAFANSQRKLECKFRPDDRSCKGLVADRCNSTGIVLKIVVKRGKTDDEENGSPSFKTTFVGKVTKVFKFCNLADFQYLPMERNENNKLVSIYDDIFPKSVFPSSWLMESCSVFLPPATFSRTDTVQVYLSTKHANESNNLVGRTRDRRSNHVKFVSYDVKTVPNVPDVNTLRYIKLKFVSEEQVLRMKQLFEERPIWTRNALEYITEFNEVQLKYLLALNAYHFLSGPYRIAWVRFGYDPRKDIASRKYQIVDYRMRSYIQRIGQAQHPAFPSGTRRKLCKDAKEANYKFKPGIIPPCRQMFYQVCDIEVPEVQRKLNSFPSTTTYDNKTGWLSEAFFDSVREILDGYVLKTIQDWDLDSSSSNTISYEQQDDKNEESFSEVEFDLSDPEDVNLEGDDL